MEVGRYGVGGTVRGLQVGVGGRAGTGWQASARAPVAQKAPEDVGIRVQQREPLSGS